MSSCEVYRIPQKQQFQDSHVAKEQERVKKISKIYIQNIHEQVTPNINNYYSHNIIRRVALANVVAQLIINAALSSY